MVVKVPVANWQSMVSTSCKLALGWCKLALDAVNTKALSICQGLESFLKLRDFYVNAFILSRLLLTQRAKLWRIGFFIRYDAA